jgi:hypothetical protein
MLTRIAWERVARIAYWTAIVTIFALAVAPIPETGLPGGDKANHFAAFLALAAGGALIFHRSPLPRTALLLIAYGGAIELAQGLPLVKRDCDMLDWVTDIAGVAAGSLVVLLSGLRARLGADKPGP